MLKGLKMNLPLDPAIPLLGIYPKESFYCRDMCTTTFIAALFTLVRSWNQRRYPSPNDWIMNMQCIYTMDSYKAIRKDITKFAGNWMELEAVMPSFREAC